MESGDLSKKVKKNTILLVSPLDNCYTLLHLSMPQVSCPTTRSQKYYQSSVFDQEVGHFDQEIVERWTN